ncbi:hypothetical protein ACS0TY_012427 [Phlomoides rotata]
MSNILNGQIMEFQKTLWLFVRSSKEYLMSNPVLGQLLSTAVQVLVELEHIVPSTIRSKEF